MLSRYKIQMNGEDKFMLTRRQIEIKALTMSTLLSNYYYILVLGMYGSGFYRKMPTQEFIFFFFLQNKSSILENQQVKVLPLLQNMQLKNIRNYKKLLLNTNNIN